jgi:hypothetical protein
MKSQNTTYKEKMHTARAIDVRKLYLVAHTKVVISLMESVEWL